MADILMPKATAVWLVDNTSLAFEQIADFTGLHHLEVKGIADGEVARDIRGADPIANGQLSREELDRAQGDSGYRMKASVSRHAEMLKPVKKGPKYTPVSRRQDRPNAILWLLRNHAELKDAQIMRLVGTTKSTIAGIRDRTHWNAAALSPLDPVTLGLCTQIDLDFEVQRASKEKPAPAEPGVTLLPAAVTTAPQPEAEPESPQAAKTKEDLDTAAVFAKLKQLGGGKSEDHDDE